MNRVISIDYAKGLAILMLLLSHCIVMLVISKPGFLLGICQSFLLYVEYLIQCVILKVSHLGNFLHGLNAE